MIAADPRAAARAAAPACRAHHLRVLDPCALSAAPPVATSVTDTFELSRDAIPASRWWWRFSARPQRARARSRWRWRSGSGERSSTATRPRSTAGFDIGTDKVPVPERRGHPAPSDRRRRADRGLHGGALCGGRRARDPGHPGSRPSCRWWSAAPGFYYRALTRGLFPGPGADPALRARLEAHRRSPRRRLSSPHGAARRYDRAIRGTSTATTT